MEKTILRFYNLRHIAFFILFIIASQMGAQEVKIVLATFDTPQRAQKKLEKLQNTITEDFIALQEKENFDVLVRPSGKRYHILTIEPIQTRSSAKKVQKLLPKHFYKDSFIGNYSLKERYKTKHTLKSKQIDNESESGGEVAKNILKREDLKPLSIEKASTTKKVDTTKKASTTPKKEIQVQIKKQDKKQETNKTKQSQIENKKPKEEIVIPTKQEEPKKHEPKTKKVDDEKNLSVKLQNKDEVQSPFGVVFVETASEFFIMAKQYVIDIFRTLIAAFGAYFFEMSVLVLIVSVVLFVLAYKKSIVLYRKIRWLQASRHEIVKDAEFLKVDISNLKAYFNSLVSSARPSLQKLQDHFQSRDTSIEEKEAQEAIHSLMHVMKSYDDFGGNIILTQKEFDLNALVKRILNHSEIKPISKNISIDFNNPMLKKVVGDSHKISRILISLITFCCKYSKEYRILIILNEVSQDSSGDVAVKLIIKNSKGGFTDLGLQKIEKAFSQKIRASHEEYDDDVLDLIAVQRILEAKRGEVKIFENFRGDSGFVFDMKLKIINRHIVQQNLFTSDGFLKQNILIFGNNAESVRTIQSELELANMNTDTCYSWNQMLDNFNDIYFFIDVVVVQNVTLPFVDIDALNNASRRKNFITVVVLEEHESESGELKQIRNKRILKRPYEKDSLPRLLLVLIQEQKPTVLSS